MAGSRKWRRDFRWRLEGTRHVWLSPSVVRSRTPFDFVPLPGGAIDTPTAVAEHAPAPTTIGGWAMFASGPAAKVEIWIDGTFVGRARLGLPRPDIRAKTGDPRGFVTGFSHLVDLSEYAAGGEELEIRAVAAGTRSELLELAPVRLRLAEPPEPQPHALPSAPIFELQAADRGRRIVAFTHRLDYGGAQTYLVQVARGLLRLGGVQITVVSSADGPLRDDLQNLGVKVHISSAAPIDDPLAHLCRVDELSAWTARHGFDLVVVNTASPHAFPGAEVAARLDIPAIWAIHESLPPSILWNDLHPGVRQLGEAALAEAAAAIFEAESTRQLYEPWLGRERTHTLPYGLDLEPIDELRAAFRPEEARRAVGLGPDEQVIACVGGVEPRKGQVPLAGAFDLIAGQHPHARLVIVGGQDNADCQVLEECLAALHHGDRVTVVPMTRDVHRWYGIADVLVCASDIESLPRSVLEGMAWELPVLATSVFGLPELIEDGVNGWLCDERDVLALAAGLERALDTASQERREIGRRGRRRIIERHSLPDYCERVAAIVEDVEAASRVVGSRSPDTPRRASAHAERKYAPAAPATGRARDAGP